MIMGFTGTQADITPKQFDRILELLTLLRPTEIHHGDCIGADSRFHQIVEFLNSENPNYQIEIHVHPPVNDSKRARNVGHVTHPLEEYLVRNHIIVDMSDVLIATPQTLKEIMRSGTWSTWRYAKKNGKETYLILPTGEVKHDQN